MNNLNPPNSELELLSRADGLAGLTLGDIADELNIEVPNNLQRHKGWVGQLIEYSLGATAGSKPQQDFAHLGIELKTLPLNKYLQPIETTYVCYAPLLDLHSICWDNCNVKHKLQCVLWVPVQGERDIPINERVIGSPILWRPNHQQTQMLKDDWEEIIELITLGQIENISAKIGEVLQLRPKAANGQSLTKAIGADGETILTRPRGFYLRKQFTAQILEQR